MKSFILLFTSLFITFAAFGYDAKIDKLYYNLSGTKATVTCPDLQGMYYGYITIPSSIVYNDISYNVTSIGNVAFYACYDLTSITIPNSVTSIGNSAFEGCTGLTSITIPNSVTSIGSETFWDCYALTSITIPNSVKSIGRDAFTNCKKLATVKIGNSVTSIEEGVFSNCFSLTSVTIGNSVTSIGWGAFKECTKLTSIIIPNSVTNIGSYAFQDCSSLTSITFPKSVINIGYRSFRGCGKITNVYNESITPQVLDYDPEFSYSTATLHVPAGTKALYKAAAYWKKFYNIVDDIPTAIYNVSGNVNIKEKRIFSIDGKSLSQPQKGINIQKMSDGTIRKVLKD